MTLRTTAEIQHFSGPLPHPSILREYEDICPGSAERILAQAERQSAHRQDIEHKVIDSDISQARSGMRWAGWITLAGLGIYALIVYSGYATTGGVFSLIHISGLAGLFLKASHDRKMARENNKKETKNSAPFARPGFPRATHGIQSCSTN